VRSASSARSRVTCPLGSRPRYEQSANVLAEAELLEAWLTDVLTDTDDGLGANAVQEATEFDTFVGPLRAGLKDPTRRASVRRTVHEEIRRRAN
jgi:hypothetical protein